MKTRIVVYALLTLTFAAVSQAALSKEHADFAKGPYQYLLTKDERKQWSAIATDDQAQAFIDLFWARRDPTPGTPANEFRDAVGERIKIADRAYSTAKQHGSVTDRGKVYIVMGGSTAKKTGGPAAGRGVHVGGESTGSSDLHPNSVQGVAPSETWVYEQSKSDLPLNQPLFQVAFVDQYASNEWKMERIVGNDYNTVFDRVARSYIAQPNLTEVPVFAAVTATGIPALGTTSASAATLKSDVLRQAIDTARAAKAAPSTVFLNYGEFVTPAGEAYVPVQLYVPKSAGMTAGNVTLFGVVEKAEGGDRVVAIEEPATLVPSRDALFVARTLTIPPGKYVATFGVATDGKPVAVVSKPMTVNGADAAAPAVSSLMLSNNVYALTEAQRPTDPFAFGGIKIVPKGDLTFRTADDLWYFMEVRNPGLDAATSQPRMTMKLAVTGKADDGTEVSRSAPAELVNVQPLKGVTGHYVVAESIPLSSFKPGNYTITLKLADKALAKSYDLTESFRVVE
jgi:GWxTD domain-containing protein